MLFLPNDARLLVLSRKLQNMPIINIYDTFFLSKKADHVPTVKPSLEPTYANDDHNAFLFHQWNIDNKNKKNTRTTKPTTTYYTPYHHSNQPKYKTYTYQNTCIRG